MNVTVTPSPFLTRHNRADLTVLIPHGGLNGDINACLLSIAQQSVKPLFVIVLVDASLREDNIHHSTRCILRKLGIRLIVNYDVETTSIIQMRRDLIRASKTTFSLFLDSDAIMLPDAMDKMFDLLAFDDRVLFVEGMRIEVGGRDDDKLFQTMEKKQVSDAVDSTDDRRIPCGDTCMLMFRTKPFVNLHWSILEKYYDRRGMGGSDFAMTVQALAENADMTGLACPESVCWHTASVAKGYWRNYVASDMLMQQAFVQAVDRKTKNGRATALADEVFNGA